MEVVREFAGKTNEKVETRVNFSNQTMAKRRKEVCKFKGAVEFRITIIFNT